jgi:hypothetical protein
VGPSEKYSKVITNIVPSLSCLSNKLIVEKIKTGEFFAAKIVSHQSEQIGIHKIIIAVCLIIIDYRKRQPSIKSTSCSSGKVNLSTNYEERV